MWTFGKHYPDQDLWSRIHFHRICRHRRRRFLSAGRAVHRRGASPAVDDAVASDRACAASVRPPARRGTPPPLRSSADCGPIARFSQTSDNAALIGKLVSEPAPIFDLVIAGAGASGLALAAAVKQAMAGGVSIALVDPASAAGGGRGAAARGCDRRRAAPPARAHRRLAGDRTKRATDPQDGDHGWADARRPPPHAPQFRSQKQRSARPYGVQRRCRRGAGGALRPARGPAH